MQQLYFQGEFRRLRDVTIDLDPLPGDLRLVDPVHPGNRVGCFTGRGWLIERIDGFIAECVARRVGGYVLVEAEAGMGKSALASFLAFSRAWPTHVTRLPGGTSPEGARTNLAAQVIARWRLTEAAPAGVLPAGHDTTQWLYGRLCEAARRRDDTEPNMPVVLLVDGLDEAPPAIMGQLPLGLPSQLPPATVVVATSRPGTRLPAGMHVERIDVESQANRDDLLTFLKRITADDPQLAGPLADIGIDRDRFCRALLDRSAGVWIYALSVLDQIRDQRRSPAEVDTLPPGLADYYANNITRWQSDPTIGWDDVALPLLGTLAAGREPLPAATMAAWAGVPLRDAKRLLRGVFKPFLVVRTGGDPDLYALRHQSLRDLLEGRLPAETDDDRLRELAHDLGEAARAAHTRIVTVLVPDGNIAIRDWSTVDDYTRTHLAGHASLCGRLDELVLDPEFLLVAGVPELVRLRRHLTTTPATASVAALELASSSWNDEHNDQLRWLEVSARKTQCQQLAETAAIRLNAPWCCRAAIWSGSSHRTLASYTGSVEALAAVPMPDGTTLLATAGRDKTVRLWDPATNAVRSVLTGHTGPVEALAAVPVPDGTTLLASAGEDETVRLWDPASGTAHSVLDGHIGTVRALAVVLMSDGTPLLASGGNDEVVLLWDPVTGTAHGELQHGYTRLGMAGVARLTAVPMPDGTTLLVTSSQSTSDPVRIWDPVTGAARGELHNAKRMEVLAAVPMPDGTTLLATATDDERQQRAFDEVPGSTIRLWDLATSTTRVEITTHTNVITLAAVPMPDGTTLLATSDFDDTRQSTVQLWDAATGTTRGKLIGHTGWVWQLAAVPMPDGTILLATSDQDNTGEGPVRLWDLTSGTTRSEPHSHTGWVQALVAVPVPGGTTLLASAGREEEGREATVRLWDPTSGIAYGELIGHHGNSVEMLVAVPMPDGTTLLALAGDYKSGNTLGKTVWLWDPANGTLCGELHPPGVWALVPMPNDTTLLAYVGEDKTVRLWDPVNGTACGELHGHTGKVEALVAVPMPDGTTLLATAGKDKTVRLWDPVNGTACGELHGHTDVVQALAAVPMPDDTTLLASAGLDQAIIIWEPRASS